MTPITDAQIATWRLSSQHLVGTPVATEADVVSELLAVQAENHPQASWAVATRAAGVTRAPSTGTSTPAPSCERTSCGRPGTTSVLTTSAGSSSSPGPESEACSVSTSERSTSVDATLDVAAAHIDDALSGGEHLTRSALGRATYETRAWPRRASASW